MSRGHKARPRRMCAACGRRAPQASLLRLALAGDKVRLDPRRRLPGRGGYVCSGGDCLQRLLRRPGRDRVFRRRLGPGAWDELLQSVPDSHLGPIS